MTIIELHSQVSNWFLWICFPIDIALKFECISRSILDGKIILEKIVFSTNSEKNDGALHNRYLDTHTDSSTLFQVWFTVQAVRADKSICEGFLLRLSTLKWGYFMLLSHRESELCKQLPPSTCARSSETEFFPSWRRVSGTIAGAGFSPWSVLRLNNEDAVRRVWSGWDGRAEWTRTGFRRISPDGVLAVPFSRAWRVRGVCRHVSVFPGQGDCFPCWSVLTSEDEKTVAEYFDYFCVYVCLFLFSAAASLEHALWLQQFTLSSPLAWIWTSLFFLCFSYKVVDNGKCPSGIPEPSLYIRFNKVRFCLFIFIGLFCVLLKTVICAS